MEESLESIRRDIEQTRLALGEKLGRLEHKIEITTTQTLNPAYYVRARPWPTLGAFAVLGWMVGRALKPKRDGQKRNGQRYSAAPPAVTGSLVRSLVSAAAAALGGAAGNLVRDIVKDRRRHTP
jgi:hypothetical protein